MQLPDGKSIEEIITTTDYATSDGCALVAFVVASHPWLTPDAKLLASVLVKMLRAKADETTVLFPDGSLSDMAPPRLAFKNE